MIVNWVKEDEELLEPYEWAHGDDIEIISTLSCYKVDKQTLHDFIYGCLHIFEPSLCQKVFAIGDGNYALAIETDINGKVCYRSVFDFCDRDKMNKKIMSLALKDITYQMYDEGEMKEYGLTRNAYEDVYKFYDEKKKQYIEQKIDELYIEDYEAFLKLCYQLNIQDEQSIQKYNHLKNKIEKGFSFIHEVLFHELTKKEYKKK